MVHGFVVLFTVRLLFKVASLVVVRFIDAADGSDPKRLGAFLGLDYRGCTEIIDVGCDPPTIVKVPKQYRSLVVATDKDSKVGSLKFTGIVAVKIAHTPIFGRASQGVHVLLMPK